MLDPGIGSADGRDYSRKNVSEGSELQDERNPNRNGGSDESSDENSGGEDELFADASARMTYPGERDGPREDVPTVNEKGRFRKQV